MSKREEYQTKIEEELALWTARFEAAKTRAGEKAPPELKQQFEAWHTASEVAQAKLVQLKATTGDEWDQIKVEMETAWHAIEGVLNEHQPGQVLQTLTAEELQSLTSEQQDAILEALVVAVVTDGKVGQDEVASFDREVGRIPWPQPREAVVAKAQAAQARVFAISDPAERTALVKSISARLPPGPIAEKTFAMMAVVMSGGKHWATAEKQTLAVFATAFGISGERLAVIRASLEAVRAH